MSEYVYMHFSFMVFCTFSFFFRNDKEHIKLIFINYLNCMNIFFLENKPFHFDLHISPKLIQVLVTRNSKFRKSEPISLKYSLLKIKNRQKITSKCSNLMQITWNFNVCDSVTTLLLSWILQLGLTELCEVPSWVVWPPYLTFYWLNHVSGDLQLNWYALSNQHLQTRNMRSL